VKKLLARLVRQSPAMIVAMLALFVALTGTAVATTSALVTGKQIKNSSITGVDVKNKSLTSADIKGQLRGPRGLAGAKGDKGDKGDTGPPGAPNPNAVNAQNADRLANHDPAILRHVSSAANISAATTYIDHPLLNNNPSARLVVTHVYSTYHDKVIGVFYSGSADKWGIFNEDQSAMPQNLQFNVLVFDPPTP
jgi:hypothetical protein